MECESNTEELTVPNVIVISDLHINCKLGLCSPGPVGLDEGGAYMPSRMQAVVWAWWVEFWNEWVPMVTRGEKFAVVVNGDSIDGGAHHNNTTHVTANKADQAKMAKAILDPVVALCEGRFYMTRGTPVHVGEDGMDEEQLAVSLGAVPDENGNAARWELWLRVGPSLVHFAHHIGVANSMAYETSAVQKELEQAYVEAARWSMPPPDCITRSHRHRNCETRIQTARGFATGFVTAGWQLKTPFTYRISSARMVLPQIGGSLIRRGDEDLYTRHFLYNISRPKEVTL